MSKIRWVWTYLRALLSVQGVGVLEVEAFAIQVGPPTADEYVLIIWCVRRKWNGGSCYARDVSVREFEEYLAPVKSLCAHISQCCFLLRLPSRKLLKNTL